MFERKNHEFLGLYTNSTALHCTVPTTFRVTPQNADFWGPLQDVVYRSSKFSNLMYVEDECLFCGIVAYSRQKNIKTFPNVSSVGQIRNVLSTGKHGKHPKRFGTFHSIPTLENVWKMVLFVALEREKYRTPHDHSWGHEPLRPILTAASVRGLNPQLDECLFCRIDTYSRQKNIKTFLNVSSVGQIRTVLWTEKHSQTFRYLSIPFQTLENVWKMVLLLLWKEKNNVHPTITLGDTNHCVRY